MGLREILKNAFQLFVGHGSISDYQPYHNAYPFTKTEYRNAKKEWPNEINNTIRTKFRSKNDVNIYLIRYLRLETGNFIPRARKLDMYYVLNDTDKILNELKFSKHKLICINDANTLDYEEK
ncbi:stealth conserved region 3 domain-containing protein [Companilactobacillus farciminis]|uniref:stealth conserved region 3 domain-containing protein n=1 Tax=Companilactobacillus farciminis TaxID=1612 RepID=UPI0019161088